MTELVIIALDVIALAIGLAVVASVRRGSPRIPIIEIDQLKICDKGDYPL